MSRHVSNELIGGRFPLPESSYYVANWIARWVFLSRDTAQDTRCCLKTKKLSGAIDMGSGLRRSDEGVCQVAMARIETRLATTGWLAPLFLRQCIAHPFARQLLLDNIFPDHAAR